MSPSVPKNGALYQIISKRGHLFGSDPLDTNYLVKARKTCCRQGDRTVAPSNCFSRLAKKSYTKVMSDITIEIHLSPNSPQEVIQLINALAALAVAVDSPKRVGTIHNAKVEIDSGVSVLASADVLHNAKVGIGLGASSLSSADVQVRLTPVETKTGKWPLGFGLRVFLVVAGIAYYVSGTADNTVQFLKNLKPHVRETKIDGSVVPFD
jgi:hypothetical protein